jgi:hypothetical protein
MDKSFSETSFDIAREGFDAQVPDSGSLQKAQEIKLCALIDKLPYLNDIDKYWARKDTEEELKKIPVSELSEKVIELEKKYQFYNFAGQLRKDICDRAPGENGKTVCNLIDSSILNISSEGRDRRWKLKELMALDKATQDWKTEKDITRFKQRQDTLKDDVVSKILMLFDEEFSEKFTQFQEAMGAPRFWALFKEQRISPAELPNFIRGFGFKVPRDFLKKITRDNLATWPPKLKKLLIEDGKEILNSRAFDKTTQAQKLSQLTSAKSVADALETVLELKGLRDNREKKLKEEDFIKMREENKVEEKRLKEEEQKREMEEAEKLSDSERNEKQKKREEQEQKVKEREAESKEKGSNLSEEKKLILDFYDKSIEHAEKVIEECANWGVRPDDIEYWGQEGVKNRMSLLKKRGTWHDYVRFNSNDKHIPSNARGDGFRFRWLNVNTGSRISGAKADSGIKYMQRYKESGYQLCVLAGAFSIDWAGSDSIVDTPVRFLEKMKSLRNNLLGKTVEK